MHTGEAALELLPQQEFDVVLLDMKLPRISGIEVMFEARKTNASARVFFMSGHSVTDLLAQAADGSTHRIYYQPYQFESLLNTLKDAGDNGLVLVADSDPEIGANLEQALAAGGFKVRVAANGSEAHDQANADGLDYLVLDQQQTVIHGLETYWDLKQRGQAVTTVIIAPCADEPYLNIEKLNQFPNCGYFIKPFSPLDLLPVLEDIAAR